MAFLTSRLTTYLEDNQLRIRTSPGDGHCLLYSLVTSLNSQCSAHPPLNIQVLKTLLWQEAMKRRNTYIAFLESVTPVQFQTFLSNYIYRKSYNNSFGDLVPLIAANTLKVELIVLKKLPNDLCEIWNILPTNSLTSAKSIVIHKKGDHFNGVLPAPYPYSSYFSIISDAASPVVQRLETASQNMTVSTVPNITSSVTSAAEQPKLHVHPCLAECQVVDPNGKEGMVSSVPHLRYSQADLMASQHSTSCDPSTTVRHRLVQLDIFRKCSFMNCQMNLLNTHQPITVQETSCRPKRPTESRRRQSFLKQVSIVNRLQSVSTVPVLQQQQGLQFALLYARSVSNKTESIHDFILDNKLDVLAITESWLRDSMLDQVVEGELLPSGFKIFNVPRRGRLGGGVAVNIRDSITYVCKPSRVGNTFECLEMDLKFLSNVVHLALFY